MKLNHALRRPLVIGFTALLSAGCSEHSDAPTGPIGEGGGAVIVVGDFAFSAPTVTIDRGESVRWRSNRISQRIDDGMNLGCQPTAGAADGLILPVFFCAPALCL
jgi:hypothetical protein